MVAAFGMAMLSMSSLMSQEVELKTYKLAAEEVPWPVGRQFSQKDKMTGKDAKLTIRMGEQEIDGTMNNSTLSEQVYDFREKGKVRISVIEARTKMAMVMNGNAVPANEEIKARAGKVFLLELKDGKWKGSVEKGEVLELEKKEIEEEIDTLEKEFNEDKGKGLYGTKPRAIGERWDVDPKFMPGMGSLDVTGGSLSVHFKEVKEFQGELCAVIETNFDVKAISNEEDKKGMLMSLKGSGRIVRSLTLFTDYKFVGEALMEMEGKVPPPAPENAQMKVSGVMKVDSRMTEIKDGE